MAADTAPCVEASPIASRRPVAAASCACMMQMISDRNLYLGESSRLPFAPSSNVESETPYCPHGPHLQPRAPRRTARPVPRHASRILFIWMKQRGCTACRQTVASHQVRTKGRDQASASSASSCRARATAYCARQRRVPALSPAGLPGPTGCPRRAGSRPAKRARSRHFQILRGGVVEPKRWGQRGRVASRARRHASSASW